MHRTASRRWLAAGAFALSTTLFATAALAECDDDQEAFVGKAIAAAASAKINGVVPGASKQMVSLDTCDTGSGGLIADYKFNVIGSDGLYWLSGTAKVVGNKADLKISGMSPNLSAASAKAGVKLASN